VKIVGFSRDERIVRPADHIRRREEHKRADLDFPRGSDEGVIYLLPIPSVKDSVHITGTDISIESIIKEAAVGSVFVGYGIPYSMVSLINERKCLVFDGERDEIFVDKNARLTAEGTLGRLMTEGSLALSDMKVGVIGYGRIGSHLCRMLTAVGADVTIFSSRTREQILRADEILRAEVLPYSALGKFDLSSQAVLINTAPAAYLTAEESASLSGVRVIELASGNNIPSQIKYERFAAVPSRMYIDSAARAYVEYYERCAAKYNL
jgi:hypothetical protein